jgi:hypothetical protein
MLSCCRSLLKRKKLLLSTKCTKKIVVRILLLISALHHIILSQLWRTSSSTTVPEAKVSLTPTVPPNKDSISNRRDKEHFEWEKKDSKSSSFAIFYNAFVNPENYNSSLGAIYEQLEQIRSSSYSDSILYYNLIGSSKISELDCPPSLTCQKIRHLTDGDEVITLQDLFSYCQRHPQNAVVYLHDKGSWNANGNNKRIRRLATVSAVSQSCRDFIANGTCNLCVNKFMLLPNHHTPGNMWVGQCSYLSSLIPPNEFDERRREMFRTVRANQSMSLYCIRALVDNFEQGKAFDGDQWKYMSIDRYAMEHWAFSGPTLDPCTTIPRKMLGVNPNSWTPQAIPGIGNTNLGFERATTTGWFQFEGRKYEMQYLYGKLPPRKSFFYSTYRNAKVPQFLKITC